MIETKIESKDVKLYESIYDYVQDADLSYYEISGIVIREAPFIEEIKPADDPNFFIFSEEVEYKGNWYRKVNFGEKEESYLLKSEVYDTVYLIYIEREDGVYVPYNGCVVETREEAEGML